MMMLRHYPGLLLYVLAVVAHLIAHNVYPSTWAFFLTAKFDWSPVWIGVFPNVSARSERPCSDLARVRRWRSAMRS
jgi:hypothetical protein